MTDDTLPPLPGYPDFMRQRMWTAAERIAIHAWGRAAIAERDAEIERLFADIEARDALLDERRDKVEALSAALKKIAVGAPPLVNGEFGIQHTDANGKPIAWEPVNPVSVVEYLVGIAVRAAGE